MEIAETSIWMRDVSKSYSGGDSVLKGADLEIAKGDFVFITGPSGSGKTTVLKLLLAMERPDAGRIFVNGRDLSGIPPSKLYTHRRNVGVVFQDFRLIKTKTVFDNVSFALEALGVPFGKRRLRAFEVLKMVGLPLRLDSYPLQLSGGEQQRAAIARAIINDPLLLLADEPTGNLDPELSGSIMELFKRINGRGTTVVVASHNRDLIKETGRRVFHIKRGRIV